MISRFSAFIAWFRAFARAMSLLTDMLSIEEEMMKELSLVRENQEKQISLLARIAKAELILLKTVDASVSRSVLELERTSE